MNQEFWTVYGDYNGPEVFYTYIEAKEFCDRLINENNWVSYPHVVHNSIVRNGGKSV